MSLVTIIIPVYKVEQYIVRCIESVINQTSRNFELILIDDASPDDSVFIAKKLLAQDKSIEYKIISHPQNKGLSAARNTGIEHATGDYLYFMDSDDWIENDTIAYFEEMIYTHKDLQILYTDGIIHEKDGRKQSVNRTSPHLRLKGKQSFHVAFQGLLDRNILNYIWLSLYKKELFDTIRFPEGVAWEDVLTLPYLFEKAGNILFTDKKIYNYWLREGSIIYSFQPRTLRIAELLDKMEKHFFKRNSLYHNLYPKFVLYRTEIIMTLSKELYDRAPTPIDAHNIHKAWSKHIPLRNVKLLFRTSKKRSAIFMLLLKYYPAFIGKWHKKKVTQN